MPRYEQEKSEPLNREQEVALILLWENQGNIRWEDIAPTREEARELLAQGTILYELRDKLPVASRTITPRGQRPSDEFNPQHYERGPARWVRLAKKLGEGGMGVVFAGYDKKLGMPVAIKQIKTQERANTPRFSQAFIREMRVLARFEHVNVPRVYDVTLENSGGQELVSIVMEELSSSYRTLRDWKHEMSLFQFENMLLELSAVIDKAADESLFHQDLKPSNIMLDAEGHVKLLDFGISNLAFDHKGIQLSEGVVAGLLAYLSPERAAGIEIILDQQATVLRAAGTKTEEEIQDSLGRDRWEMSMASEVFTMASIVYELITKFPRWPETPHNPEEQRQKVARAEPLSAKDRQYFVERAEASGHNGEAFTRVLERAWNPNFVQRLNAFDTGHPAPDVYSFARNFVIELLQTRKGRKK